MLTAIAEYATETFKIAEEEERERERNSKKQRKTTRGTETRTTTIKRERESEDKADAATAKFKPNLLQRDWLYKREPTFARLFTCFPEE